MQTYQVLIKRSAEKDLDVLQERTHKKISSKIARLGENPRPPDCKCLQKSNGYRIRIGDYRILYVVSDDSRTILIYAIGHRREVYR